MELSIENSCRICLQSDATAESIFAEVDGKPISESISEICGVKIEAEDQLSKKICENCRVSAINTIIFRQLCIDSDETVRYNLLLADGSESLTSLNDSQGAENEKTLAKSEEINFFIHEETEDFKQVDEPTEYDELFINDESAEYVVEPGSPRRTILIERVDSEMIPTSSLYENMDISEIEQKMRQAHFAREQLKKHKCPHCDKYFKFPSKVIRHLEAVHKDLEAPKKHIQKNYLCTICSKAFVSRFKVRRHMVVHDTELKIGLQRSWSKNFFLCSTCNKKCHTQATFDRHNLICELLQRSTIDRPSDYEYHCTICSTTFPLHDEMVHHMKSHRQKPHQCTICPDVVLPLYEMIRHSKHHEVNATFKCHVCQKLYPNGDEIVMHLLRHKGYKPFNCEECGKSFFDKYKLRQHQTTHDPSAPKNFVCQLCDRAFGAQDYLNCHMRRKHSSSKPYKCSFCPKSFAFAHDLSLHQTVHTGDKKHVCVICDSSFTKAYSLKQHLLLHEDKASNHECSVCQFIAPSETTLQQHLTHHLNLETTNEDEGDELKDDSNQNAFHLEEIQSDY